MAPQRILIVGATSAIAEAAGRIWSAQGARLAVAGRSAARLDAVKGRLGAVAVLTAAVDDPQAMAGLVGRAAMALDGLDVVLVAHGSLTDQARAQRDPAYLAAEIAVNLTAAAVTIEAAADYFERQGHGAVAVIGSVAGDRGKARNYAYGLAKAALDTQMQGLRNRLAKSAVRAIIIKPGPVDTPMTATHRKSRLFTSPDRVAADIVRAIAGGRGVVYSPWWWRWIMQAIRLLPEPLFIRTRL